MTGMRGEFNPHQKRLVNDWLKPGRSYDVRSPYRSCLALLMVFGLANYAMGVSADLPRAREILHQWQGGGDPAPAKTPHVVLWTPADREFADESRERLQGVLKYAAEFFQSGMRKHGFSPLEWNYEVEPGGPEEQIRIHSARGKRPMAQYNPHHAGEIREDCFRVLRAAGINPHKETVFIFCNASNWDESNATYSEMPSFDSYGSHVGGLAWLIDSPILNTAYLAEEGSDFSHATLGRISLREYNRHALYRILRQIGHALGLADNSGPLSGQLGSPVYLMGEPPAAGDPAWLEEPEMTVVDALVLASHPLFGGYAKKKDLSYSTRVRNWNAQVSGTGFQIEGEVTGAIPVYAIIAYLETKGPSVSHHGATFSVPDQNGRFVLDCTDLVRSSAAEARVVILQANGAVSGSHVHRFPYQVGPDRDVDLTHTQAMIALMPFAEALWKNDHATTDRLLNDVRISENPNFHEIASRWMRDQQPSAPKTVLNNKRCTALSDLSPVSAETGYGPAVRDRLPGPSPLLISGGRLFTHGLYAHAPSTYQWKLDGTWQRFHGSVGLAQDHPGSAVFEIVGDGVLLWRSPIIRAGQLREFQVPVKGVLDLVLKTTDAEDGKNHDWSLWLEPKLTR